MSDDAFSDWMRALEERHLANLRVQEVTRALRALSSVYVERRDALHRGAALESAGKRAAFALFYGPLHYLVVRRIIDALGAPAEAIESVVDLGCGTGAAGAAWAAALGGDPRVLGIDRHPWAVAEARWTYRAMGLSGSARRDEVARVRLQGRRAAIVMAFTANELGDADRERLLPRLMRAVKAGAHVVVVEPVTRAIGGWWQVWADVFRQAGGREDTWRFEADLPERLRLLDRAAGLDHRVLTARSLYAGPGSGLQAPGS